MQHPERGVVPDGVDDDDWATFVTDGSGLFPSGSADDMYTGGSKDSNDVSTWVYKKQS